VGAACSRDIELGFVKSRLQAAPTMNKTDDSVIFNFKGIY
jgi:hypothetical protein